VIAVMVHELLQQEASLLQHMLSRALLLQLLQLGLITS
jgi:hypothetical protein